MAADIQGRSIRAVAKNPTAYLLMICAGVASVLVSKVIDSNSSRVDDCKEENIRLVQENKDLRDREQGLIKQVFIDNAVIENIKPAVDSIIKNPKR